MPRKAGHVVHNTHSHITHATPGQAKMLSHGVILKKPGGTIGSEIKLVITSKHHHSKK
jgi:hypothetical protein